MEVHSPYEGLEISVLLMDWIYQSFPVHYTAIKRQVIAYNFTHSARRSELKWRFTALLKDWKYQSFVRAARFGPSQSLLV